ncbi:MAG: NusA-like transcription termination signal-binding factor, partial [Desulfurococcaceae archaeon]
MSNKEKTQAKITPEEFRYMALLSELTNTTVRDCIIDEENNRIIFMVNPEEVGKAIGPRGFYAQQLRRILNKNVEIVGYSDKLEEQVKLALLPVRVREMKLTSKPDGSRILYVTVNPEDKALAIGKGGRNIQKLK